MLQHIQAGSAIVGHEGVDGPTMDGTSPAACGLWRKSKSHQVTWHTSPMR